MAINSIIYNSIIFKDFTNHRTKTNRAVVFAAHLSPAFLNTGTTDEIFRQSGKQDFLRHLLKSSANI